MFREFLVVFVFQNGVFSFPTDDSNQNLEPKEALMKLISRVVDNEKRENIRYEDIEEREFPISLDYYDFNNPYYKKEVDDPSSDLLRDVGEDTGTKEVRVHVIKNPKVLEQYQKYLKHKRHSAAAKQNYKPDIYKALEDIIYHLRRNSAFHIDPILTENVEPKSKTIKEKEKRLRSLLLNIDPKKEIKFDDWDTTTKKSKDKKKETSYERKDRIVWNPKKNEDSFKDTILNWDDEFPKDKKGKKNKEANFKSFDLDNKRFDSDSKFDNGDNDYKPLKSNKNKDNFDKFDDKPLKSFNNFKEPSFKPQKPYDNYKESHKPIKSDSYKPYVPKNNKGSGYKLKLTEGFKPNYKPLNDDDYKPHKKANSNKFDDYKPARLKNYDDSYKHDNPAYKQSNYQQSLKNTYDRYKQKKVDRSGGSFGRTPIPYAHRGVYED